MDSSTIFRNLLRTIEDSQLNYTMSRTPFSATISLKCSFLKRFKEGSQISDLGNVVNVLVTDSKHDQKVKEIEAEKSVLQVEIENLRNSFENDQKKSLKEEVETGL